MCSGIPHLRIQRCSDPCGSLAGLLSEVAFSRNEELARREIASMSRFENGEIEAIVLAPLDRASFEPDTVLIYGNPAQACDWLRHGLTRPVNESRGISEASWNATNTS